MEFLRRGVSCSFEKLIGLVGSRGPWDCVLWKEVYSGRNCILEGTKLWKGPCSGRDHALEGTMLWKELDFGQNSEFRQNLEFMPSQSSGIRSHGHSVLSLLSSHLPSLLYSSIHPLASIFIDFNLLKSTSIDFNILKSILIDFTLFKSTSIDFTLRLYESSINYIMHPKSLVLALFSGLGAMSAVLPHQQDELYSNDSYPKNSSLNESYSNDSYSDESTWIRCGTPDPPPSLGAIPESFPHLEVINGTVDINTYMHVVSSWKQNHSITPSKVTEQV